MKVYKLPLYFLMISFAQPYVIVLSAGSLPDFDIETGACVCGRSFCKLNHYHCRRMFNNEKNAVEFFFNIFFCVCVEDVNFRYMHD